MIRPTGCFKRLMKLLRGHGRSEEEAEDLIQEALLRLHEYCVQKKQEVRDEEAFLLRTVHNLHIDQHRRDRRHLYVNSPVEELEASRPLADPAPAPDEVFAAQQRLREISDALEAISTRTREVFFAHRAGYGQAEIAAYHGISESAVEKHIARAVDALVVLMESR